MIEKEEGVRAREEMIKERAEGLDARAEIMDLKDRQFESDRHEIEREWARLLNELERFSGQRHAVAQAGAGSRPDLKAWKEAVSAEFRLLQNRLADLLHREEELRHRGKPLA